VIEAPEIVEHPVGTKANEVAGAVGTAEWVARVRDETGGREFGTVEVPAAESGAPDEKFAFFAMGNLLKGVVDNQEVGVVHGRSDGNGRRGVLNSGADGVDGGFGGAVEVEEFASEMFLQAGDEFRNQRLASEQELMQSGEGLRGIGFFQEKLGAGRGSLEVSDLMSQNQVGDGLAGFVSPKDHDGLAQAERPVELLDRDVEGEVRGGQPFGVARRAENARGRTEEIGESAMFDEDPFGLARGSRGVEDVG